VLPFVERYPRLTEPKACANPLHLRVRLRLTVKGNAIAQFVFLPIGLDCDLLRVLGYDRNTRRARRFEKGSAGPKI
jgi:hypothetical protein